MGLLNQAGGLAYNAVFKRNSTFFAFIVVTAFGFEIAFDNATRSYFETVNKGRLWKDVQKRLNLE